MLKIVEDFYNPNQTVNLNGGVENDIELDQTKVNHVPLDPIVYPMNVSSGKIVSMQQSVHGLKLICPSNVQTCIDIGPVLLRKEQHHFRYMIDIERKR